MATAIGLVAALLLPVRAAAAPPSADPSAQTNTSAEFGLKPPMPRLTDDALLRLLVEEALTKRPELSRSRAAVEAERESVAVAGAMPDPLVTLGLQDDGFDAIRIGEMETSYASIMASQTFPWLGKRGLRGESTELSARRAETDLERVRLSVEAEVAGAYVDLLLLRGRLGVLNRLEALWTQSEGLARARFEAGEGPQSDVLRAQLERNWLRLQRWALEAEDRRQVTVLNRLCGRAESEPIDTSAELTSFALPELAGESELIADAEARSPERKGEAGRRGDCNGRRTS